VPRVILPENFNRPIEMSIDDTRWQSLRKHFPATISDEVAARLHTSILVCVSRYLTRQAQLHEGMASARALRRPGKRQLAPLERLVKGLRIAADAWKEIKNAAPSKYRPPFHDDQLSDLRQFDVLEGLAKDAERRLAGLRSLGKPQTVQAAWRMLVRDVADCFRKQGINPSTTGRAYETGARLTWFQNFMAAVQAHLLGMEGKRTNSPQAFAAETARALRGDRKPGKARR
jgi:hypothetical protein